jgi:hypothetical protein
MSSPDHISDSVEDRFQQLEKEINAKANDTMRRAEPERQDDASVSSKVNYSLASLISWINGLTGPTKVAAIVVVGLIAFSILSFVLKLVSVAISLSILALVGYVLYKIFFEKTPTEKK